MNSGALKYLNNYLGGNLNIGTLTVEALTELMESYAKMKVINSKYNIEKRNLLYGRYPIRSRWRRYMDAS